MSVISAGGSAVSYGSYAGPASSYPPAVRLDYGRSGMSPGPPPRYDANGAGPDEAVAAGAGGPIAVPLAGDDRHSQHGSVASTLAGPPPAAPQRRRACCRSCPCTGLTCRDASRIAASTLSGVLKGLVLSLLLVPMHTLGCIAINTMCLITWIDAGYYTLRWTKAVGFNLKLVLAALLPLAVILYFIVSALAAMLGSLLFSLTYPAVDTMNVKIQTAWRCAYLTASWEATFQRGVKNVMAYHGFCTVYVAETMKKYRNPRYTGPVADIHPWNFILAVSVGLASAVGMALACLLLMCVKAIPIMMRAVMNHMQGRSLWFRGGIVMPLAWVLYFLLVPVAVGVAIPASAVYGVYIGVMAGVEVMHARGALLPAGIKLREGWTKINSETTRYILHYDVPFLVIPSSTPVILGWVIAGFMPLLLGLPAVATLELIIVLISYVSALWAGYAKLTAVLFFTFKGGRYHIQAGIIALMLVLPAVVFVGLFAYMLGSVLGFASVVAVTHSKRSIIAGLQYVPATIYKFEYAVNKFCYAMSDEEQVHWASFFPCFLEYARTYMSPKEFDEPVEFAAVAIVGKPARFMPKGMRRPQRDANGKLIDLTGVEGHIVPGKGILISAADGRPERMIPFSSDGVLPPGVDVAPYMLPADAVYMDRGMPFGGEGAGDAATEIGGHTVVTVASLHNPALAAPSGAQVPAVRRPMCLCCAAELDDEETDVYDPRAEPPAEAAAVGDVASNGAAVDGHAGQPGHVEASSTSAGVAVDADTGVEVDEYGMGGDHTPNSVAPYSPGAGGGVPPATPYMLSPVSAAPGGVLPPRAPAPLYVSDEDDAMEAPPPTLAPAPPVSRAPISTGSMSGLAAAAAKRAAALALRERRGFNEHVVVDGDSRDTHPRDTSRDEAASQATTATATLSAPVPVVETQQPPTSARTLASVPPPTPVRPPPHSTGTAQAATPHVQDAAATTHLPAPLSTALPVAVTALTSPVHIQANAALARAQAAMQHASIATAASRARTAAATPAATRSVAPTAIDANEEADASVSEDAPRATTSVPASPARAAFSSRNASAMPSPAGAAAMPRAPAPILSDLSATQHATAARFASSIAAHVPDDAGDSPAVVDIESPAPVHSRASARTVDAEGRDEFVLQPIVRAELPDVWARVPAPDGSGGYYFVNYARNQSAWKLPPAVGK